MVCEIRDVCEKLQFFIPLELKVLLHEVSLHFSWGAHWRPQCALTQHAAAANAIISHDVDEKKDAPD